MASELPEVHYVRAGEVDIAYQVVGAGPIDLVIVPPLVSHLEIEWELGSYASFLDRLSSFCRLVRFDKRGMGLSDRIEGAPTLEERMDDLGAVLDDLGVRRAHLLGISEGGALALLFGATHPEVVESVSTFGGFARLTAAPDFPEAHPIEFFRELIAQIENGWGHGLLLPVVEPTVAGDVDHLRRFGRFERLAGTPGDFRRCYELALEIDIRDILPLVQAPTLVMQTKGDAIIPVESGRFVAEHVPNGRFVALDGDEHWPWGAAGRAAADTLAEFLVGTPDVISPDRVLATVLFTDIGDSTRRAADVADRNWRALLDFHDRTSRTEVERQRGRLVKSTGDGVLATFDGPARAVRAAMALKKEMAHAGLPIRAGLHTGEIELRGDDVGGIAVHIAARIAARADVGEIIVSRTVKDLSIGSGLTFEDHGEHTLKGVPDTWHLYGARVL
jgi:pimeloyl-ACP methyl ester carboxylesterase